MKYLLQKKGAIQNVLICTSNRFFPRKKKSTYLLIGMINLTVFQAQQLFIDPASVEKKMLTSIFLNNLNHEFN